MNGGVSEEIQRRYFTYEHGETDCIEKTIMGRRKLYRFSWNHVTGESEWEKDNCENGVGRDVIGIRSNIREWSDK